MYRVVAFIHNANKEELEIASKWLGILEADGGRLYNIPNHRVEDIITDHMIIITFGGIAKITATQCIEETKPINTRIINLPKVSELTKEESNREKRQETYDKLQSLKDLLKEDIFLPIVNKVNDLDLPDLQAQQILMLKKIIEEEERDNCFQVTKEGQLIEISQDKLENSKADIHITFSELYTIRSIMDVLGVTEVDIIQHNKKDST